MARPRKNAPKPNTQELSLVPVEEQPYPLPEGWKWVRLGDIASKIADGSHNPPKNSGSGIPILSATNIQDRTVHIEDATRWISEDEWKLENKRTKIENNDILITIVGTLGRVALVNNPKFALQRSVAVIKTNQNQTYLSYFFESPYVQDFINKNAKGTAQKGFYLKALEKLCCALPPLDEQERIVTRIESLFAKLDEAKEKAEAVLESYETRKAAILHKAFTGELTAKWREEKGIGKNSWILKTLDTLIKKIEAGKSFRCEERPPLAHEVGVVKVSAVTWGVFNEQESKTCLNDTYYNENYQIKKGDLLFSRANTIDLVGKFVIVDNVIKKLMLSDKILRITTTSDITQNYLFLFSNTRNYRVQIESL
ncbi:MAG: restriction endonuclease subunit S, partial [Clostridia bacterium]|nr:restriction endonuclease subunit S [Clostridia bacterium]